MFQFDKMYTIECLLVSFIFYSLDVRFIYYSIVFFFPASQLVELKYWCILQVTHLHTVENI